MVRMVVLVAGLETQSGLMSGSGVSLVHHRMSHKPSISQLQVPAVLVSTFLYNIFKAYASCCQLFLAVVRLTFTLNNECCWKIVYSYSLFSRTGCSCA